MGWFRIRKDEREIILIPKAHWSKICELADRADMGCATRMDHRRLWEAIEIAVPECVGRWCDLDWLNDSLPILRAEKADTRWHGLLASEVDK